MSKPPCHSPEEGGWSKGKFGNSPYKHGEASRPSAKAAQIRVVDKDFRPITFSKLNVQSVNTTTGRGRSLPSPGEMPSTQHPVPLADRA